MENLIERYVYDVARRLPEKEREEVSKELSSNIYDMLPENADENEIKAVLYQLGAPVSLAEKYRQKPRYLISPAIYDDYVRVLKWILPLVGGVVLTIGMILGAIDALKNGMVDASYFFSNIFSKGIAMGAAAALQALVWTTVGYAIAERVGTRTDGNKAQEWKIEDLPKSISNNKGRIPLSDSLTELILTVAFSVAVILACSGVFPIAFMFSDGNLEVVNLFSPGFLANCIPAIAVMAFLGVCECIVKIKERRWTPLVCGTVIISNLISMGILVYLINRSDLFSTEFLAFLQSNEWSSFDLLRFAGTSGINPIIVFVSIIVVVCSLVGCGIAVYKTAQSHRANEMGGFDEYNQRTG